MQCQLVSLSTNKVVGMMVCNCRQWYVKNYNNWIKKYTKSYNQRHQVMMLLIAEWVLSMMILNKMIINKIMTIDYYKCLYYNNCYTALY